MILRLIFDQSLAALADPQNGLAAVMPNGDPKGELARVMPNSDPEGWFFYPTLILMVYWYNIAYGKSVSLLFYDPAQRIVYCT